jgi:NADH dehydrogenase
LFRQLGLADCAQPIRAALRRSRVIEATVESVDLERQLVRAVGPEGGAYNRPYDHLVLAPGASTNDRLVPGSNALTIKTMADALVLRDHLIERSERADAARRCECLTVVVIGGWLVGVELIGELAAFADNVLPFYSRIRCDEACFRLSEAGPRILPEIDARLAPTAGPDGRSYAALAHRAIREARHLVDKIGAVIDGRTRARRGSLARWSGSVCCSAGSLV